MTIGELKAMAAKLTLPDSTRIVVPGLDHSYLLADAEIAVASREKDKRGKVNLAEYYEGTSEEIEGFCGTEKVLLIQ
jgi:hypothetical protein